VDVLGDLTDSRRRNNDWKGLKNRLKKGGTELVTNCKQVKISSSDRKFYAKLSQIPNNYSGFFNRFQLQKPSHLKLLGDNTSYSFAIRVNR
jgi:hypothetical protein